MMSQFSTNSVSNMRIVGTDRRCKVYLRCLRGMVDMNIALTAELGDLVFQIDQMTYDEQDVSGLIKINQQQTSQESRGIRQ